MTTHTIIEEFPDYSVSDEGDITNIDRGRKLKHQINSTGVVVVYLYKNEVKHCRSVASLVAKYFVRRDMRRADTVIHLDGDRQNVRADNLAWRPRPFAIMYHHQFLRPYPNRITHPLMIRETEEVFPDSFKLATAYGLLERAVVLAAMNYRGGDRSYTVFPHNFHIVYL